jgi:hypothetical protein
MLLTLGACNSRAGTAARECALRYPGRRHPDANVFRRLEQRLRETGRVTSTAHVNADRPRTVRTPANEDTIIAAAEREPWRSSRDIAKEFGLSQPSVLKVLHDDQLHSYHYSRSAHLFPDDRPLQMQFYEWLHQHAADELLLHNILWWTDEACFTREGVLSVHSHLWARDNPHAIRERGYQVRFSVNVWVVIVGDIVVGLYLLPDRLTAQRYRDFLETVLPGLLEDVPRAVKQRLWFQHDGALANCGEDVQQWLNAACPGRWIGRGGPIAWPPRSPDQTPMYFFLWGHLKEQVYAVPPRTIEDLVTRIQSALTGVDANMLRRVRENAVRRTAVCLEMDRGLFEHML